MMKTDRKRYDKKHLDFFRAKYAVMPVRDLTPAFNEKFGLNKTEGQIFSTLKNHKITCGRKPAERKYPWKSKLFTPEQSTWIHENYEGKSRAEMVRRFNERFNENRTEGQITSFVKNHHVRSGRTGHFKKGNCPWNAGTKGLVKPNSGNFQKGQIPKNTRPLGSERIDNQQGFVHVKIAEKNPYTGSPQRFKHKHVVEWERTNGPVPKDKVLTFKDGNRQNTDPANLILISRAESMHLVRRGYRKAPDELKPTVLALAKLEVKTFERMKR